MITTHSLVDFKNYYEENLLNLQALEKEAKHIILSNIKEEHFQIHHIYSRIKELNSCILKILEKDSLEINDIVGIRIVCLFLSDLDQIGELISECLNQISFDDKITDSALVIPSVISHTIML